MAITVRVIFWKRRSEWFAVVGVLHVDVAAPGHRLRRVDHVGPAPSVWVPSSLVLVKSLGPMMSPAISFWSNTVSRSGWGAEKVKVTVKGPVATMVFR